MLYNEIRPVKLAEVVGQPQVTGVLAAQEKSGKFSNTYLFVGVRGTGKTTSARILARAMNCTNKDANGEPCGCCPNCQSIMNGTNPDVIELDAARNRTVEDARKLIEQTQYAPQVGKRKVFIIDEVHMFSTEAFNSLLKTLEDPPQYCTFILCTTEEYRVPATIISRCQKFNFGTVDNDTIANLLAETLDNKGVSYQLTAMILIAIAARGSVRDAISILDKCLSDAGAEGITEDLVRELQGIPQETEVFELLHGLAKKDTAAVVSSVQLMEHKGYAPGQIVLNAQEILADCIRYYSLGLDGVYNIPSYQETLQNLCQLMDEETAISCMAVFVEAKKEIADIAPYTSLMARMVFYLSESQKVSKLDETLKKAEAQLAEVNKLLEQAKKELVTTKAQLNQPKAEATKTEETRFDNPMPEEPETVEVEPSESEVIETAEPVFDEVEEDESEFSSFDDGFETLDEEGSVDINSLFGCEGNQVPSKRTSSERNSGGADPEANGDGEEYSGEDEGESGFDDFFNW